MRKHYNPERSTWKGRSYKKGGERVRALVVIGFFQAGEHTREAVARALVEAEPS